MKEKVFVLMILAVFILLGVPHVAKARPKQNVGANECTLLGFEIVFDVNTGKEYCCDKGAGSEDLDNEDICTEIDPDDSVPYHPAVIDEPPKKKDPKLTPRPMTEPLMEQPKKGTTRQPAQEVR